MITVKTKLNFHKYDFTINYYENQSITDFEFLIILMISEAVEKNVNLLSVITEFTKGENDIKLLIEKRFQSLFKTTIDNYKTIVHQAKEMETQTKKLVPVKKNVEILYEPNLKLFFYNNEFKDENQIKNDLSIEILNNKNLTFNNIDISKLDKTIIEWVDIQLSSNFDKFNILNLSNQTNKTILKYSIESLKENTM